MTTLRLSEVESRLSEITEEVATRYERVQVINNGCEYVVLVAADDLESRETTLELLANDGPLGHRRPAGCRGKSRGCAGHRCPRAVPGGQATACGAIEADRSGDGELTFGT